jgi:hypothetical protein
MVFSDRSVTFCIVKGAAQTDIFKDGDIENSHPNKGYNVINMVAALKSLNLIILGTT